MSARHEIGAYEAKTHLPELLRNVQAGQRFTITHRGTPVAELIPAGAPARENAEQAAFRMREFMSQSPPLQAIDVKALIEEGRD